MLQNGEPEAESFLPQLDFAEVSPWKCPCGCASINFQISGADPPPGVHILGDYLFSTDDDLCGTFVFESGGLLSGIEVYGLAIPAPKRLPSSQELRPFGEGNP